VDSLPCNGRKGLCCGPVPITKGEVKKIRRKLKLLSSQYRAELESQTIYPGTCIFYDSERDKCGIYSDRPQVCRSFGYHQNLICFKAPSAAQKKEYIPEEPFIGMLSIDLT
jgi:uncharacterized protein